MLPTLILNKDSTYVKHSPFVAQVFPQQEDLAKTLAREIERRNIRSVAILKPSSGKADLITTKLAEALDEKVIGVAMIPYVSGDFGSMNSVAQEISGTDIADRREEYYDLFMERQKRAQDAKQPFNPRSVILKALPTADAVFIPDNFRIVKHFAHLLKYHGVRDVHLIGNNEWRASGLLYPWDRYLQGAFFADFVGSYNRIPEGIERKLDYSEYFVAPSQVVEVDFQLIGYRASAVATRVLDTPDLKRHKIIRELVGQRVDERYFPGAMAFNENRTSRWPTYVFRVEDRGPKAHFVLSGCSQRSEVSPL